jgi:hypothetical protein
MTKAVAFIIILNLFIINSLAQWTQIPSSPSYVINNIVVSDGILFLSHSGDGVYKSTDSTVSWQQINNGLNTTQAKSVHQVLIIGDTLYAATVDGIYKSTNGGDNWIKKSNGITIGPGALYEFCKSIFEYGGSLFTGAWNGIYRSTDGAENWFITNITGEGINAKNFVNHNGILFAARENINNPSGYKSFDGGINWNGLPVNPLYSIITFYSEPGKLWAGTIHGVWLSTNDGINWEDRSNGLSPDPYSSSIIRINGNLVTSIKFGGSGVFRSSDDGLNWEDFGGGLPFLNSIEKMIVYDDKIIAATSNGLWQRDTSEVITALEEQNKSPQEFKLFQNYPNPFNPKTSIQYVIGSSQFVTLKVYDVLGNEVATLVDQEQAAGSYEINFEADGFKSGIYFYTLNAGSFTQTKKLVLLK